MNQTDVDELAALDEANEYVAHGDPASADCILAFSFGYAEKDGRILPGLSNKDIAQYIEHNLPELPIIAQFEVADALRVRSAEFVIHKHRTPGAYLGSQEVALQAQEFMNQRGWKRVVIVTHTALEARNDYLCAALEFETVAPAGLEVVAYDPASVQSWTRSPQDWWQREAGEIPKMNAQKLLKKPAR